MIAQLRGEIPAIASTANVTITAMPLDNPVRAPDSVRELDGASNDLNNLKWLGPRRR
jgi:hypothetical protein